MSRTGASWGTGASWEGRQRAIWNRRLTWFGESPSEDYWARYWEQRLRRNYFDRAASHDVEGDELGRILLDQMSARGPHLEAGCGPGFWVAALRSRGFDVEGIESSPDVVRLVETVTDLPVHLGDALAIPRPDGTYGTYLSFGVVEHDPDGPGRFFAEAHRVLRPAGRIVVTVPHHGPVRRVRSRSLESVAEPPQPFFQYGFTAEELTASLTEAGFTVEGTRPLYVHRLLMEESGSYRRLARYRGARLMRGLAHSVLAGRDGHMIAAWGRRD